MTTCIRGFTLMELLIVVTVVALLAALLLPAIALVSGRAKTEGTRAVLQQVGNAIDIYRTQTMRWPPEQAVVTDASGRPTGFVTGREAVAEQVGYRIEQEGLRLEDLATTPAAGLGNLLEIVADLRPPSDAFGLPVAGLRPITDGWKQPIFYQRFDEAAASGPLRNRAVFWLDPQRDARHLGRSPGRSGYALYSVGSGGLADRTPALPGDDSTATPGGRWSDPDALILLNAGR
jgi:prepilin-type N-terminal cleavage/methylation domain-containing protein